MEWVSQDLRKIPRQSNFPLQVTSVYYCNDCVFLNTQRTMPHFEVSLRLAREASEPCCDLVDGKPINLPWPHTVFKVPGMNTCLEDNKPRNTISFSYEARDCDLLRQWNLIPEEKFWQINIDTKLEELIADCCSAILLTEPSISWIGFVFRSCGSWSLRAESPLKRIVLSASGKPPFTLSSITTEKSTVMIWQKNSDSPMLPFSGTGKRNSVILRWNTSSVTG